MSKKESTKLTTWFPSLGDIYQVSCNIVRHMNRMALFSWRSSYSSIFTMIGIFPRIRKKGSFECFAVLHQAKKSEDFLMETAITKFLRVWCVKRQILHFSTGAVCLQGLLINTLARMVFYICYLDWLAVVTIKSF